MRDILPMNSVCGSRDVANMLEAYIELHSDDTADAPFAWINAHAEQISGESLHVSTGCGNQYRIRVEPLRLAPAKGRTQVKPELTVGAKASIHIALDALVNAALMVVGAYEANDELNELQPVTLTARVFPMSIDEWVDEIIALRDAWDAIPAVERRTVECPVTLAGCFRALGTPGHFRTPSAAERHTYTCQADTQIWCTEDRIDVLWYPTGDETGDKPVFHIVSHDEPGRIWSITLDGKVTGAN